MIINSYDRGAIYGSTIVLAEVEDASIVVHGPMGCFAQFVEATLDAQEPVYFTSSTMSETDVIFGGEKALRESLRQMKKTEAEKHRFVLVSPTPAIIGDHTELYLKDAQSEGEASDLTCIACEIGASHYEAINKTLLTLAQKHLKPCALVQNRVNLVGNLGESLQWKADVREMKRILELAGMDVKLVGLDNKLEDFEEFCQASLNILLVPEIGLDLARFYEKELDIPYIVPELPIGIHGTTGWLTAIGNKMGLDVGETLNRETNRVMKRLFVPGKNAILEQKLSLANELRVAIVAQESVCRHFARFLAQEMEMQPVFLGCRTRSEILSIDPLPFQGSPVYDIDRDSVWKELSCASFDLLLGSSYERAYAKRLGAKFLHIANPNYDYANINPRPYLGFTGLLNVIESILNQVGD